MRTPSASAAPTFAAAARALPTAGAALLSFTEFGGEGGEGRRVHRLLGRGVPRRAEDLPSSLFLQKTSKMK